MRIDKKFIAILSGVLPIGISLYFIFTTVPSIRYWVDDFCSSALLHKEGFWGTQISLWNTWSGRYSATFFTSVFELVGPWVVKILPVILLLLLILSAKKILFGNLFFATLFVILTLVNSPNIIQSFYWQTGSLNYLIPFVFLNFFLAIIVSKKKKIFLPLAFVLMLVAGGFSEAFALAAEVFLILVVATILIINPVDKKERLKIAAAGIMGLTLSLILMFIAPGNSVREATVTRPESIDFVISSTLVASKSYLFGFFKIKTLMSTLGILMIEMYFLLKLKILNQKKSLILMGTSVFTSILITVAVIGSGFYSMSIIPPDRTLSVVVTMILMCFLVFAYALISLIKHFLDKRCIGWILATLGLVFSLILVATINFRLGRARTEIVNYANSWDIEVKSLPTIRNIAAVGGLDNFTDNKGWVQGCVAGYFNLEKINIVR